MRNLSLSAFSKTIYPVVENCDLCASTVDIDDNILYVAFQKQIPAEADVLLEIYKHELSTEKITKFSSITSGTAPATLHIPSQVVSLRVSPETRKLVVILAGGDLATIAIDEGTPAEIEGSVDCGILAADWSPDDNLLVLVTSEQKVILMTSMFDVLFESPLAPSEFGEDAQVNVGWGSKQTQFHGSQGKAAAQAPASSNCGASPDDDGIPRISWRGDGAYFVVSSLSVSPSSAQKHRVFRVYDRQGQLQSTSEPVAGLEHSLSWRPSGNLIAGTQRFGFEGGGEGREGRHAVVFFERNGLRHGEFDLRHEEYMPIRVDPSSDRTKKMIGEEKNLRWGYKVRNLLWSADSDVLAVWLEEGNDHIVQLWTSSNYHWYLKQEIRASHLGFNQFTSILWHPEKPLHLLMTTERHTIIRKYAWETCSSSAPSPRDTGSVAVVDGTTILLTPFRIQNVPPPMSSFKLKLPVKNEVPIHIAFSSITEGDRLVVAYESGKLEAYNLRTKAPSPGAVGHGGGIIMNPELVCSGSIFDSVVGASGRIKQIGAMDEAVYALLSQGTTADEIVFCALVQGKYTIQDRLLMPGGQNSRTAGSIESQDILLWQKRDGQIYKVRRKEGCSIHIGTLPQFCFDFICTDNFVIGLSESGKLYALPKAACMARNTTDNLEPRLVASNCSSFTMASGFLIFTTTIHEVIFAPLETLYSPDFDAVKERWEKRRVERGSRIVVAVPSTMSLVLQMPRGNLETINPRPLVMKVVRDDLDVGNFRKAFLACRKHRIDLNIIVEHDPDAFMNRLDSFVEQVHEPDYINLLLTVIGRGSQSPTTVAQICDAIRLKLEQKHLTKYINSVLTAYVVKSPPDYEAGLAVLLRLKEDSPSIVEDAVKYIIFLVDANKLFDIALGMYDFSLVLMIAQYAQKDPREYLPFLRELRSLDKFYQRFRIDNHLKRYEKALHSISMAGPEHFDEAATYVETHQLHDLALEIWKGTDRYNDILVLQGNYLFDRREFRQAAVVFTEAKDIPKVMVALERALDWQILFALAANEGVSPDELGEMAIRVAEELCSKKRYADAGRVLVDYTSDTKAAVIAYVQGNHFSEALRIISIRSATGLVVEVLHPAALESCFQITEDLNEMKEQLRKQTNRITELRVKKMEEPDIFYGIEDSMLHNVDVMTDISMPATAYTRYTAAPSTASRTSKRSSRSKRKQALKEGAGRKGTVHEEEYLLNSITKLVSRFNAARDEARNILPHLLRFTEEHRQVAASLQKDITAFEKELQDALEVAWENPPEDSVEVLEHDQVGAVDLQRQKAVNPVHKVPKAELSSHDWRIRLLDLEALHT